MLRFPRGLSVSLISWVGRFLLLADQVGCFQSLSLLLIPTSSPVFNHVHSRFRRLYREDRIPVG